MRIPQGRAVKDIVREALEEYGGPFSVPEGYNGPAPTVLCLLLDSHWYSTYSNYVDLRRELIAPGKLELSDSRLRLGLFISRTLWSWPSCMDEVIHAVLSSHATHLTSSSKTILNLLPLRQELVKLP